MSIHYRPATRVDTSQLVALMNSQYARVHESAYFQWQFFDAHYPTVCITAWDGERLAGMFGTQKRRLTDGTIVGHLIDLLIDPGYRGQGIFAKSCSAAIEYFGDLEALTVLPNLHGKNASVKSLGMQSIAKIDDLVLTRGSEKKSWSPDATSEAHWIGFAASPQYHAWRYGQNPVYTYTTVGSAITKEFKDPKTSEEFGDIVDWIKDPSLGEIRNTDENLFGQGQESISTWALPHTQRYGKLRGLGFTPVPRERYFCLRALQQNKEYLYDISGWQLVPGDAEIY